MQDITTPDQYWATLPTEEVGHAIVTKVHDYYQAVDENRLFGIIKKSYRNYYGLSRQGFTAHDVTPGGRAGALKKIKVNHYRSLIQTILHMATAEPPAFQARAINTDYKSSAQTLFANGLIEYYRREKHLGKYLKNAAETSLVQSEGWLILDWDTKAGEDVMVDPMSGEVIKQGDVQLYTRGPLDVIRDFYRQDSENDWLVIRHEKNRWDLEAQYPEYADKIRSAPTFDESRYEHLNPTISRHELNTDRVVYYEFRHSKRPSLPSGRKTCLLADGTVLIDEPFEWEDLLCYRIAPGRIEQSAFSYTPGFDLLGIGDMLDVLYSTVFTNQSTFGVQNIWSEKGSELNVQSLAGGLRHLQTKPGFQKPEALNLTETPAEIFKFMEMCVKDMESLSGVNAVARGNPPPNLKSGSALALVASQAVQFNSGFQASYNETAEQAATGIIKLLQRYAHEERTVAIVGKQNRAFNKAFKSEDVSNIARIVVDTAPVISKTQAGKIEIATQLLQSGLIQRPEQFIEVMETGKLEHMTDGEHAELMNIKAESEDLREGKMVRALITDDHALHIREHTAILASPEARQNPQIIEMVLAHLNEHEMLWQQQSMRPALQAALGLQPAPIPQMMSNTPPMEGQPVDGVQPPTNGEPAQPNMPNLPPNAPPEAQQDYDTLQQGI